MVYLNLHFEGNGMVRDISASASKSSTELLLQSMTRFDDLEVQGSSNPDLLVSILASADERHQSSKSSSSLILLKIQPRLFRATINFV